MTLSHVLAPWTAARHARPAAAALVLGLLLALVGGTLVARPAAAHDALVSSDPPAGAVLDAAPAQIVLTFSSDLLDLSHEVRVTAPDGTDLPGLAPAVAGPQLTVALPAGLAAGAYTVLWRVVSGDGHPVEGTLTFSLTDAAAPPTAAPATPSATASDAAGTGAGATPTASSSSGPTTGATADATDDPTAAPSASPQVTAADADAGTGGGLGAAGWVGVGIAVLAAVVAAALFALRRPRDAGTGPTDGPGRIG